MNLPPLISIIIFPITLTGFIGTGLTVFWIKHLCSVLVCLAQWFSWKPGNSGERDVYVNVTLGFVLQNLDLDPQTDMLFELNKIIKQMEDVSVPKCSLSHKVINQCQNKMLVLHISIHNTLNCKTLDCLLLLLKSDTLYLRAQIIHRCYTLVAKIRHNWTFSEQIDLLLTTETTR